MADSVADKSGFLCAYMSNHPDTLVAYVRYWGKVTEKVNSASIRETRKQLADNGLGDRVVITAWSLEHLNADMYCLVARMTKSGIEVIPCCPVFDRTVEQLVQLLDGDHQNHSLQRTY